MKTDIYQSEPGHKTDFPLPLSHANSLNRYQRIIAASFFDSTMRMGKNAKRTSYLEVDILQSINRDTGQQFKSICEINTHVEMMVQKKLLTD